MGASLFARGRATSKFQAIGTTSGHEMVTVIAKHSLTSSTSAGDVFQMIKIPNGAQIVGGWLTADSAYAFTFHVGLGTDPDLLLASVSVSASRTWHAFFGPDHTKPPTVSLSDNADPQYDTLDVLILSITAKKTLNWEVMVQYVFPGKSKN